MLKLSLVVIIGGALMNDIDSYVDAEHRASLHLSLYVMFARCADGQFADSIGTSSDESTSVSLDIISLSFSNMFYLDLLLARYG